MHVSTNSLFYYWISNTAWEYHSHTDYQYLSSLRSINLLIQRKAART